MRSNSILDGQNRKLTIDGIANEHAHIVNNNIYREKKRAALLRKLNSIHPGGQVKNLSPQSIATGHQLGRNVEFLPEISSPMHLQTSQWQKDTLDAFSQIKQESKLPELKSKDQIQQFELPLRKIREERIEKIKKKIPTEKMNIVATVVDALSNTGSNLQINNTSDLKRLSSIQVIDAQSPRTHSVIENDMIG